MVAAEVIIWNPFAYIRFLIRCHLFSTAAMPRYAKPSYVLTRPVSLPTTDTLHRRAGQLGTKKGEADFRLFTLFCL